MPIIQFPKDLAKQEYVTCALCKQTIGLAKATAGLFDADGAQVFACNEHFWEGGRFIIAWIDFASHERMRMLNYGKDPSSLTTGVSNARFIS